MPASIGTNRSRVIAITPTKMYSPYADTLPVSALASRVLDPYRDSDSPNGPRSSITPRSRILDVRSPSCSAGSITYRL